MGDQVFARQVGSTIGGCRVSRKIGAGGMGVVFEAHHLALDKRVALKLLMPHLAADSSFVKRFVTEARLAAQVEHPNIVQVLNVGQDGDLYFIIMQFVEGRSLAEMLRAGPMAPREAAKIALQAARGLAAAHKRGIIHRDVKPENILIDSAGVARVVDMGLSKNLAAPSDGSDTAALTAPGVAMGTPNYISPEQATEARTADARADIYSLGATLYHALAGAPPYSGPSAIAIINQHINAPLPALGAVRPNIPPELDRLVARMMAKLPDERIQTMDVVVAELRRFLGAAGAAIAVAPAPARTVGTQDATVPAARLVVEEPAQRRTATWKYVLLGAAGMLAALILLITLANATDPARKAFRAAQAYERANPGDYDGCQQRYADVHAAHQKSSWGLRALEAGEAVTARRTADAAQTFEELMPRAGALEKSGDWAGAEKLWRGFPASLAGTDAGKRAAERRDVAHIARRSTEFFAAMAEARPESLDRANAYCDPRQDEKLRRLFLDVAVGLVRLGKGTAGEFQVDSVEMPAADRAFLRTHFTMSYGAFKPPERRPFDQHWERVGEEWFLVAKPRSVEDPGQKRPRVLERPERPGKAGTGTGEAF